MRLQDGVGISTVKGVPGNHTHVSASCTYTYIDTEKREKFTFVLRIPRLIHIISPGYVQHPLQCLGPVSRRLLIIHVPKDDGSK